MFLLALGWALRQIGFQWLKSVTSPDEEAPLLEVPLLQEVNSRECAINIVDSEYNVNGRNANLLTW